MHQEEAENETEELSLNSWDLGIVGIDVNARDEFCQHHVELYQLLSP